MRNILTTERMEEDKLKLKDAAQEFKPVAFKTWPEGETRMDVSGVTSGNTMKIS